MLSMALPICFLEYFLEPLNILNTCTALPIAEAPNTSTGTEAMARTQRAMLAILASVVSEFKKSFNFSTYSFLSSISQDYSICGFLGKEKSAFKQVYFLILNYPSVTKHRRKMAQVKKFAK